MFKMLSTICALSLVLATFSPRGFASLDTVKDIQISGNKKTKESIILQEVFFGEGDGANEELILKSVQSIKDLGLFESVTHETTRDQQGNLIVRFDVKEKSFNFILPKLNRNGEGDITTGIVWRSENLFGRNQQSKLTLAHRTFEDTDEEKEVQIKWRYRYPRISGGPYSLSINAVTEDTRLEETVGMNTGEFDRDHSLINMLVGRWLRKQGPSKGLTLSFGPTWETFEHEFISGTPGILPDITAQGIIGRLEGYYVQDHLMSRSGKHFIYELTIVDEELGSDINYVKHYFVYRNYVPLNGLEHTNFNYQFRFATISRPILGPPEFKAGGSTALRGFDRDEVEGNTFAILNLEWLRPLFNRETLRGALIFDLGNAWEELDDISLSGLRYSAGIGLRWKLKRFVRTDIRLDVAHGLSDGGETKVFLATKSTF